MPKGCGILAIYKSVYLINYEGNRIEEKDIPEDFNKFVEDLIVATNANKSVRRFKPRSQATEVINLVRGIISDAASGKDSEIILSNIKAKFEDIAKRSLRTEVDTQEMISKMGRNVKKGSLVQALIIKEETNDFIFLIAKVEHSGFIDDIDFKSRTGFSSEQNKIWKTCVFDCLVNDEQIIIESAKIHLDSSSKFWQNSFLELDEMKGDEANTNTAFKNIDTVLARYVKTKSPSDYVVLRNTVIGYFKNPQHFDYDNMVETVFENYSPTDLDQGAYKSIKEKIKELPDKMDFDRQFNSVPSAINARIKKIYQVYQGIEIKINDYVGEIKETIQSVEESTGERFIKIKATNVETFNAFK